MRISLFTLLSILLLTGCSLIDDYGKKITIGTNNEVFYKGGATEDEAKRLGDYLKQSGFFSPDHPSSVQLTKDVDTYWVRFVYRKEVYEKEKEQVERAFWLAQEEIAGNVFDGKETRIALTDNKFKDFEKLEPVRKVQGDGYQLYVKGGGFGVKEPSDIADSLVKATFFDYTNGHALLSKDNGVYTLRFQPNEQRMEQENYLTALSDLRYIISRYALNGSSLKMYVMRKDLSDRQEVPMPPEERKAYFDNLLTGGGPVVKE